MSIRLYSLGFFCFILVFSFADFRNNRGFIKNRTLQSKKFGKMPNKTDLTEYLEALDRIVDFCSGHKNYIDINFYFGLLLANVNLKRVYKDKHQVLPGKIRVDLLKTISNLEALLEFFSDMIRQDRGSHNNNYKAIFTLFANTKMWIDNLPNFHEDLSYFDAKNVNLKHLLQILNTDIYNNVNGWMPNPQQSNQCLEALALSKENNIGTSRKCEVLPLCYRMLHNGTDFSYPLAHRLLLLQLAKFGRDCSIFSEQEDKKLGQRFCYIAYQEAEYIAQHDYTLVDILLEHVTLCALDGHAKFLQRSWFANSLRFQTVYGCFSQDLQKALESADIPIYNVSRVWTLANKVNHDIMGICNGHTTGLAASALAMAIRFILETY